MPRVSLHTLGCKLNYAETSMLGRQFIDRGFSLVEFGTPSELCIINTCSVTERANRECRQMVRKAVRTSANPFVVVTGCYAQLAPEEVAAIEGVDLVLGSKEKFEIFDHIGGLEKKLYPHVVVSDISEVQDFGPSFTSSEGDRTRAFLKIQDGCDYNCSFCTIPLARGASRSQSLDASVKQAAHLVEQGFREITLTGVNVGDYGNDGGDGLLALLRALVTVRGLERIRISSIEPNLLEEEIIEFVAREPVMCKHFHIPLQSGCDDVLRQMRRRYTTAQYAQLISQIRRIIPECGVGVDVITGFPGETDEHFLTTLNFIESIDISYLHVFTYSERPNTPAAAFGGSVEPKVRFKRNEITRSLGLKKKQAFYAARVGETLPVLMESDVHNDVRFGFTSNYVRVGVNASSAEPNEIVPVLIHTARPELCIGDVVREREGHAHYNR
jgi:threonylcarbamoyladenosine tRNA methylthiotransferase MtaB